MNDKNEVVVRIVETAWNRRKSMCFTSAEKQVLLSLINKYKEILENKNVSSNEKATI